MLTFKGDKVGYRKLGNLKQEVTIKGKKCKAVTYM